jgi:choline dehydrogenase-like flavoprotein
MLSLSNGMPMSSPDFVVVGAGSAGCVLAYRLAALGFRITLVEPPSIEAPEIDRTRPSRWLNLLGSTEDWGFQTAPCVQLASRVLRWPRGRGLGGSSRINAMIWFPPTQRDLLQLVSASGGKWNMDELQQCYEQVEACVQPESPAWLSDPARRFMKAANELRGAEPMIYRRLQRRGRRWIPSQLLTDPISQIEIVRGLVERVVWDRERAVGVRLVVEGSRLDLKASQGVVLAAGALATPMILMRSGIGPTEMLTRFQIKPHTDIPSLGHHLKDHLIMPLVFERRRTFSSFAADPSMQDLARWQVMGTGPIASNLAECGGFFATQTIQIHVTPTHYLTYPQPDPMPAMTIGVNVTQPASAGSLRLTSADPSAPPEITAGYLQNTSDLEGTIQGVHLAREIAARSPLAESLQDERVPGSRRISDDEIARSIRRYAQTLYHPSGTCRLGTDRDTPIDDQLAIRGTERLWAVDASVLPHPTLGNPNATLMMLAWFAGQRIASQV